jgi:hypothetical protein
LGHERNWTQVKVKKIFHLLLAEAKVRRITLYDLRHAGATLAVAAGVSARHLRPTRARKRFVHSGMLLSHDS